MADVDSRFIAFLRADASIAAKVAYRIHQNHIPESSPTPHIWFRRRQTTNYTTLDSAAGEQAKEFAFDVEIIELDAALEVAELVRSRCNTYRGAYGDSTVQGIFVNDQDQNYQQVNESSDRGEYITALDVQVFT